MYEKFRELSKWDWGRAIEEGRCSTEPAVLATLVVGAELVRTLKVELVGVAQSIDEIPD